MENSLDELSVYLKAFDKEFLKSKDIDSLNQAFKRVMYEVKNISTYWHDFDKLQRKIFKLLNKLADLNPDAEAATDIEKAEFAFADLHVKILPIYDSVIRNLREQYILWRNFRCNTTDEGDEGTKIKIEQAEFKAWNEVGNELKRAGISEFTYALYHYSRFAAPKLLDSLKYHYKRLSELHIQYVSDPSYVPIEAH